MEIQSFSFFIACKRRVAKNYVFSLDIEQYGTNTSLCSENIIAIFSKNTFGNIGRKRIIHFMGLPVLI